MDKIREQALKPSWSKFSSWDTGQKRGVEMPPRQKPVEDGAEIIDLISVKELKSRDYDLFKAICDRRSVRTFNLEHKISLDELSFLLISTNGILDKEKISRRTAPSGGARHAIETYIYADNVEGLEKGVYRYLPIEHKLTKVHNKSIDEMPRGENFTFKAPLMFAWSAIPSRMEWRYGLATEKLLLLDAGHICQNLYLACEALNFGTCAVGAYNQKNVDKFFDLDGEEELIIYAAPVGMKK